MTGDRSRATRPRVFWVESGNRVVMLADRRVDDDPWLRHPSLSVMLSDADGGPGAIPASTVELVPAENLDERKRHTEACAGVDRVIAEMGLGEEFAPIDPDDPTDLADVVLNLCEGMVAARRERDDLRRGLRAVKRERDQAREERDTAIRERDALTAEANAEVSPSAAEQVRALKDASLVLGRHFGEDVPAMNVPRRVSDLIVDRREQERAAEAARRGRQIVAEDRDRLQLRANAAERRAEGATNEAMDLATKLTTVRAMLRDLARDA